MTENEKRYTNCSQKIRHLQISRCLFLLVINMHKHFAKRFYDSKEWKKCRESYISKVHGVCEHCGEPGYILDHIEELTPENINDPNITLNHENLQYLCLSCHNTKTFKKYKSVRDGLMFDGEGNLVQAPPSKK